MIDKLKKSERSKRERRVFELLTYFDLGLDGTHRKRIAKKLCNELYNNTKAQDEYIKSLIKDNEH